MNDFWNYDVWGFLILVSVLLLAVISANALKRMIKPLRGSLLPASVLGGIILLVISYIYQLITGSEFFDLEFFGGNGNAALETITYHSLALGFIATAFKTRNTEMSRKRMGDIINTGITTVSTYLLQGVLGLLVSIIAAFIVPGFFKASGLLLPFGYGQGTGQALNYGAIYENDFGFAGGKGFGLSLAALGFLSASAGGIIYLNILKHKGIISGSSAQNVSISTEEIQGIDEIPMQESMDKITIQFAFVTSAYLLTFIVMRSLGSILPGLRSVIFGFNFLLGVLMAVLIKTAITRLTRRQIIHRSYLNSFLMTRISNLFFDLMVVAGIAAIRLHVLKNYWVILIIMGILGLAATFVYNRFVANVLFPGYKREQFLMMYGMLTGTASTGIILLRELDYSFSTPAADNMVYQNFPAIVIGFPLMLLATMAPNNPETVLLIIAVSFVVLNIILFRKKLFRTKSGT
ncbi:MAG: hypothetical protein K6E62_05340 [Lachnospiraceae bacterium]|nr:hypothetical protein [Lachnospiraceae bacterium]